MTQFVLKDTVRAQIQSVVNFMNVLGFQPLRKNLSFVNMTDGNSAAAVVSLATATKLHNSTLQDWSSVDGTDICVHTGTNLQIGWNIQTVLLADASRLVEKSKVSVDRRGNIIMNSENAHLVKAANPRIQTLLG